MWFRKNKGQVSRTKWLLEHPEYSVITVEKNTTFERVQSRFKDEIISNGGNYISVWGAEAINRVVDICKNHYESRISEDELPSARVKAAYSLATMNGLDWNRLPVEAKSTFLAAADVAASFMRDVERLTSGK